MFKNLKQTIDCDKNDLCKLMLLFALMLLMH